MTIKTIKADWPLEANIEAFTTTRIGGVSNAPYDSFNLALHVGDKEQHVEDNRIILHKQLALPNDPKWLQQVHSKIVVNANHIESDKVIADAVYTDQVGVVCGVLTADCLPVVLASKKGHCVGVAHAGWKGLQLGIIQETVNAMSAIAKPDYAWLGPAIGPQAFEVGADVYQAFVEQDRTFVKAFTETSKHKWYFNIYVAASIILKSLGIHKIYGGNHCTYTDSELFFSYRRTANTGRMATLIWLK